MAKSGSPTRLVRTDSQARKQGILLNGPNSDTRPAPLRIPTSSEVSTDSSLSPGFSSPDETSATSGEEGPTAPMKLRFSTPLPSSGKKRSNSITLGVAARAQLLSQQNAGPPVQRAQPAPQASQSSSWYSGGAIPSEWAQSPSLPSTRLKANSVYTVSDAKAGLKKAWSKVKRKRRTSEGSVASTASTVSTDSSTSQEHAPIQEEPALTRSGEATPKRRPSPPPSEEDRTSALTKSTSVDADRPSGTKIDVLGFDSERTHDHTTEYESELWSRRSGDDASSTVSEEDSRDDSLTGEDEEDDAEDAAERLAAMSRKTSSAACVSPANVTSKWKLKPSRGYEVVERHKT